MTLIGAGRTFLLRDRRMGTHLWLVLTDPDPQSKVVTVVLVTERAHTERTVRLDVGDHPFVRHPTNVDFGAATYFPVAKLERAVATGRASLDADLSVDLLARVRRGLIESSHTPNDIVAHCRVSLGV
jgi:hypothetical protein